jgi:hypothetical protein
MKATDLVSQEMRHAIQKIDELLRGRLTRLHLRSDRVTGAVLISWLIGAKGHAAGLSMLAHDSVAEIGFLVECRDVQWTERPRKLGAPTLEAHARTIVHDVLAHRPGIDLLRPSVLLHLQSAPETSLPWHGKLPSRWPARTDRSAYRSIAEFVGELTNDRRNGQSALTVEEMHRRLVNVGSWVEGKWPHPMNWTSL